MDADPKTLPHRLIDEDGELLCADCQGCFSEAGGVLGPGDETGECGERWKSECAALRARIAVIVTPVDGVDVEEVLRLDREATPGPWDQAWPTCVTTGGTHGDAIADGCEEEDAELIATYRTAAPALAREVQRLRAELDQTRTALRLATDPKPDDLLGVRLVNGCASLPDDTPEWVALLLREAWTAIRVLRADAEGKATRIASLDEEVERLHVETEDLRLTLAAERGDPAGAPDPAWCWVGGGWERDYPDGEFGGVMRNGRWYRGRFGQPARVVGEATSLRASMIACDGATP